MADIIDGVTIRMGAREFVVPPMNLKLMRRLLPKINSLRNLDASMDGAQMDVMVEIVHSVLTRNYPALTTDEVEDLLDFRNMQPVLTAIMGVSGLEKPEGEAQAGSP
jgi:hypothetical protein